MNLDERFKYLRLQRPHYLKADKRGRGILLDEMGKVTHLGRTTLIRHMKENPLRKPRTAQRGRRYGHRVDDALRVIAESLDYVTAVRLKPNLIWTAECLARHGELILAPEVVVQLEKISVSTIGRILKHIPQNEHRLPQGKPQAANGVLKNIPIWNVLPGINSSRGTLRLTSSTTAGLSRKANKAALYSLSMSPQAGASA